MCKIINRKFEGFDRFVSEIVSCDFSFKEYFYIGMAPNEHYYDTLIARETASNQVDFASDSLC